MSVKNYTTGKHIAYITEATEFDTHEEAEKAEKDYWDNKYREAEQLDETRHERWLKYNHLFDCDLLVKTLKFFYETESYAIIPGKWQVESRIYKNKYKKQVYKYVKDRREKKFVPYKNRAIGFKIGGDFFEYMEKKYKNSDNFFIK